MIFLDNVLAREGKDIPIVFRDPDPKNPLWIKPLKYYGLMDIVENDENLNIHDVNRVIMLSDIKNPFPKNSYLKDP